MTYFADLTPYRYAARYYGAGDPLNVGWLDGTRSFSKGPVSAEFLDGLWQICRVHVAVSRGAHDCELCEHAVTPQLVERGEEKNQLGASEIRVFGKRKTLFAAPSSIYHYVVAHEYRPPAVFIEAVLAGPRPPSSRYMKRLATLGLDACKSRFDVVQVARAPGIVLPAAWMSVSKMIPWTRAR